MDQLETENIWEVGSVGSGCSLDDELSQELEEMERREEEQQKLGGQVAAAGLSQPVLNESNGNVPESTTKKVEEAAEESDCGGDIIFKDTGVINVADCNEIADAYKAKRPYKRFGLSGAAAAIARRERKRLQYQQKKLDPNYLARRTEYRRRYRQKAKLLSDMRAKREAAAASTKEGLSYDMGLSCKTGGAGVTSGGQKQMVFLPGLRRGLKGLGNYGNALHNIVLNSNAKKRARQQSVPPTTATASPYDNHKPYRSYKKFASGSGGDVGRGGGGGRPVPTPVLSGDSDEDLEEYSSDISGHYTSANGGVSEKVSRCLDSNTAFTLEAMRMRFCPGNVVADDGRDVGQPRPANESANVSMTVSRRASESSSCSTKGPVFVSPTRPHDTSTTVSPSSSGAPPYDHAVKVVGKIQMVSLRRFRHLQRLYKRLTSKIAYYQTVIRRDRAVIALQREELHKAGLAVDCSHFKIPNFRLKNLHDVAVDIIQNVDAEEAEAYDRILTGELVNCNDDRREPDLPDSFASPYGVSAMSDDEEGGPASSRSSNWSKKAANTSQSKIFLSNYSGKKKQIAVKSSRGGLKMKFSNLMKAKIMSNGADSVKNTSGHSQSLNLNSVCDMNFIQLLQERAEREGRAFALLKSKCVSQTVDSSSSSRAGSVGSSSSSQSAPSTTKNSRRKPGPASRSMITSTLVVSSNSSNGHYDLPKSSGTDMESKSFNNSWDKGSIGGSNKNNKNLSSNSVSKSSYAKAKRRKTGSPKKPRELQDDVYVPDVPIDMSDTVSGSGLERDDDLYDIVLRFRQEEDAEGELGGAIYGGDGVTPELKRKVCTFVEEATAYERLVYGSASGDTNSEEGSTGDPTEIDLGVTKHTKKMELCGDESSPSSRDQFLMLLHRRFTATNKEPCTLKMFSECLPKLMVRKSALSRGYTSCLTCGQAELHFENLVSQGILDFKSDFEDVLVDKEMQAVLHSSLDNISNMDSTISTVSWAKHFKGHYAKAIRTGSDSVGSVVKTLKRELDHLRSHVDHVTAKHSVMRAALSRCLENETEALIHVTWTDTPKVYHRSISRQIMSDQCLSLLSGYVWTANDEYSFACLSDQKEHSTSALWAHLEDALRDLALQGYTRLFVVSDPTVSQYRNKAHFYYMNEFAVKKGVEIRWIFSASYHTHLNADICGQKLKELIERTTMTTVRTEGDNPHRSAHSIIEMLRESSDARFYFVRSEQVLSNTADLPNLQSIKGTQTFAEVLIAPGKFLVKLDSLDEYWTKVLIIF